MDTTQVKILAWYDKALFILAGLVLTALVSTSLLMKGGLGTSNKKAKFGQMFSNNRAVNVLAAARVFRRPARHGAPTAQTGSVNLP